MHPSILTIDLLAGITPGRAQTKNSEGRREPEAGSLEGMVYLSSTIEHYVLICCYIQLDHAFPFFILEFQNLKFQLAL